MPAQSAQSAMELAEKSETLETVVAAAGLGETGGADQNMSEIDRILSEIDAQGASNVGNWWETPAAPSRRRVSFQTPETQVASESRGEVTADESLVETVEGLEVQVEELSSKVAALIGLGEKTEAAVRRVEEQNAQLLTSIAQLLSFRTAA